MLKYQPHLKGRARQLRKDLTDSEQVLWSRLRRKQLQGVQFYRQKTIGSYIVDFYAPKANLVVEVDGSQHLQERHIEIDKKRDDYLRQLGLKVLRFNSREVLEETEAVVEVIWRSLAAVGAGKIPPDTPLKMGGK